MFLSRREASRSLPTTAFPVRIRGLIAGLLLAFTLAACGDPAPSPRIAAEPNTGDPLRVVATFSVIGDLVQRVAGEEIDVRVLVGPGGDPHDFKPLPADQAAVADADLIFAVGLGYEVWLDRLVESSGTGAGTILVSAGITPILTESGQPDPHIWHDVKNAIAIVGNVNAALRTAAPTRAAEFDRRAAALIDELSALDTWAIEQIAIIPPARRLLVVNHDSFRYLARRYGLEMVGAIVPALAGEAVAPSAGAMAELIDRVRDSGAPAVLAEKGTNSRLAAGLAREAGLPLVDGLYSASLGPPGGEDATYSGMIRANIETLVAALTP